LNRETRLIFKAIGHLCLRDCLILSSSVEPAKQDDSEWISFIKTIKNLMKNETQEIKDELTVEKERQDMIL